MPLKRVLVLCTGNSARSQIAEGLLRHLSGGSFDFRSAGIRPGIVRPEAIAAMAELGIDISGHRSKHVHEFEGQHFDFVITVCDDARQQCPVFPDKTEQIHWSIPDPATVEGDDAERFAAFRDVRDRLQKRVRDFVKRVDPAAARDVSGLSR